MPRLKRFSSTEIAMFFADHPPPHFHVLGREGAAQVRIDTLEVIAASGRIDLQEALDWAVDNPAVPGGEVEGVERMSIGRIESALTRGASTLVVAWDDGRCAEIDLAPVIAAREALAPLADPKTFHRVHIAEDGWSIEWPGCGIDFGGGQLRRWADEQAGIVMPASAFRAWIERHAFTLDRAAEALGLSRRTIAYYLSGEQPVPKTVMLATEGYDGRRAA
jgi:hypothetical protein